MKKFFIFTGLIITFGVAAVIVVKKLTARKTTDDDSDDLDDRLTLGAHRT